jgi:hypothetical protein
MKYYHITKKNLAKSILIDGLRANEEGHIFLFENKSIQDPKTGVTNTVADCIAENQIYLNEYAMLEIDDKGIDVELINDSVGEISSRCQWIAIQPIIKSDHINLFGIFKSSYKPFWSR